MIGVVDYGAGNLGSVANALERLGLEFTICRSPRELRRAERVLLPGVGHFGPAMQRLDESGLGDAVRNMAEGGTPLLGICLGLQLLFETSDEAPGKRGLGLLPGRTVPLEARRVPQMGWNRVEWKGDCPLSDGGMPAFFYFAHSYVARLADDAHCLGTVDIEERDVPVVVGRGRTWGVQFHPEKSGPAGLSLLERFARC
jgi:glutamine amidotransferase